MKELWLLELPITLHYTVRESGLANVEKRKALKENNVTFMLFYDRNSRSLDLFSCYLLIIFKI